MKTLVSLLLLFSLVFTQQNTGEEIQYKPDPSDNTFHFTVLHTSDLHSHFDGAGPDIDPIRGHFARLKTVINSIQNNSPTNTLTLDAGDWFSGSLIHLISVSKLYPELGALELKFLSDCKYDATTFGNHEFDPTESGIYHLLEKSVGRLQNSLPMVLSNILFAEGCSNFENLTRPATSEYSPTCVSNKKVIMNEDGSSSTLNEKPKESVFIVPHVLKELVDSRGKKLKVGIMGMFGPNAAQFSAAYRRCVHFDTIKKKTKSRKAWKEYVNKTKQVATDLREKYGAQLVIMLAHSGEPEDNNLMTAIHKGQEKPLVDVHISSHTHHIYLIKKNVKGANTFVHQAGPFATNLGVLQFEFDFEKGHISRLLNENVPIKDHYYEATLSVPNQLYPIRIPITSNLPMDKEYEALITGYRDMVDQGFLQNVDFKYSSIIGKMPTNWTNKYQLAQYVNDCLLNETNKELVKSSFDPIHVFIVALGAVRTEVPSLRASNVTGGPVTFQFSDAYRMLGIGYLTPEVSNTVLPGDPISHFYIHRREFHAFVTAARLLAQFAPVKDRYTLSFSSSLDYKENKWGIPFLNNRVGKVYDLHINHVDYDHLPEYIHIGMPGWLTRFFSEIGEHTMGLVNIYFRDRQGRRLQNAIRSDLRDYILFSRCIMGHTERGDLRDSTKRTKIDVKQKYPEAESTEEASLSDAAKAGATPEASPEDLRNTETVLDDIQMTLLNQ